MLAWSPRSTNTAAASRIAALNELEALSHLGHQCLILTISCLSMGSWVSFERISVQALRIGKGGPGSVVAEND